MQSQLNIFSLRHAYGHQQVQIAVPQTQPVDQGQPLLGESEQLLRVYAVVNDINLLGWAFKQTGKLLLSLLRDGDICDIRALCPQQIPRIARVHFGA